MISAVLIFSLVVSTTELEHVYVLLLVLLSFFSVKGSSCFSNSSTLVCYNLLPFLLDWFSDLMFGATPASAQCVYKPVLFSLALCKTLSSTELLFSCRNLS